MKADAAEKAIFGQVQGGNGNLCQMDIHRPCSVHSRHRPFVDDRQVQIGGDGRVDAAFRCPRVNRCIVFVWRQSRMFWNRQP